VTLTLDNTCWELRAQVGPWKRSTLYRVGLAVHLAGEADSEDAAHELVWDAMQAAHTHASLRGALEDAGVDVEATAHHFGELEQEHIRMVRDEEYAQLQSAHRSVLR
jgi:hypothetical protein